MCGGFTCSKNALTALNILYVLVACILIGVAVYGRASALVTNLPIIGGILACGIILILISILGLIGAIKHHQVILFFYMLILFLLFLVQFSVACACLAVNRDQQRQLAERGWEQVNDDLRLNVQQVFGCCYLNQTAKEDNTGCPVSCATSCPSCLEKLQDAINYAFKLCGGIGLFFSFTEFLGVWLTVRYRNQKDPRANPSAYL
ncbi:tetraspanin-31 [Ischnura elegans]|uniref:tetraspanin-31 n=1 Tax=Ischnura elegans TaxID=197161 RepID=UPI001ED881F7|nr:tetraspanin-31 [Ischnura elegans]